METLFTELERKEFIEDGLTEDEIDSLEAALSMSETAKLLPEDVEKFINEEYMKKIPSDNIKGFEAICSSAENDPEFFKKLMALDIAMSLEANEAENNVLKEQQKTIVTELPDEQYETARRNFAQVVRGIKDSDRKEFANMMINLTEEQKADMVQRLTRE